jgi:hypothetical protein
MPIVTVASWKAWPKDWQLFPQSGRREALLHRKCPYCGANLDPSEICDCREKAAPGEQDREAAQVNDFTESITEKNIFVKE